MENRRNDPRTLLMEKRWKRLPRKPPVWNWKIPPAAWAFSWEYSHPIFTYFYSL